MEALAFIDLLGFRHMVGSDYNIPKEVLNDFYNITYRNIKQHDGIFR
jgi:hypothetical protein